jgi:hypothetical protein
LRPIGSGSELIQPD